MRKVKVAATTCVERLYLSVDEFREDATRLCAMQGPGRPDQLGQGAAPHLQDRRPDLYPRR